MKLIAPQSIAFTAEVTEDEIRERMALEVLEQIGALDENGTPLPNIKWQVKRGQSRRGGYVIHVTGPAPVRLALAAPGRRQQGKPMQDLPHGESPPAEE